MNEEDDATFYGQLPRYRAEIVKLGLTTPERRAYWRGNRIASKYSASERSAFLDGFKGRRFRTRKPSRPNGPDDG